MCSQFALALLANGFFHELRSTLMRPPDIYLEAELHQARLPLHSYFLGEALAAAHSRGVWHAASHVNLLFMQRFLASPQFGSICGLSGTTGTETGALGFCTPALSLPGNSTQRPGKAR